MNQAFLFSFDIKRGTGFTLAEMAIVLAIIALLMTGLLPTISSQIEQQQLKETRNQLKDIEQALIGFAIINGRLPCPATSTSNGVESPVGGGACTNFYNGFVPAATLGISSRNEAGLTLDAWNNPIRYAVTAWNSTNPVQNNVYTTTNGMATAGLSVLNPNLLVCATATGVVETNCGTTQDTNSGCKCATTPSNQALTAGNGVPAVIYSIGKNGATGGTGTDESKNPNPNSTDNNRIFVSHTPASPSSANGEFDDLVIWISNATLLNRMVTAGKLP